MVLQDSPGDGFRPSREEEKMNDGDPGNKDDEDNVVDENIVYGCADDLNMPNLEEIVYLDNDEDVAMSKVNTPRPKAILNVVQENQAIHNLSCKRKELLIVDHMTGKMSYLSEYKEIDGGYVAFGEDPKGGKITRKGKISTDTECVVLSLDFKLLDESQVLLRVLRKNNMYSVDLKNVATSGGLTCLLAKATLDESNLWHRRLGHINFKTMNKLVRGNLVRGLPSKIFENNHTCIACQKEKQHKASSTKDETSGILKSFVKGVENLIDHKVMIIRRDNRTKFKNKEMNQFCKKKGIKREFSIARTPQQNEVAEKKNRTLIEVARTMLADSKLPTTFGIK
nr:hypothetical protein [Tanacetum cinerariifolium]